MAKLWAWLLDKLQARCDHAPMYVEADILEGDAIPQDTMVRWCRLCGAYARLTLMGAIGRQSEWTRPRPTWWLR